MRPMFMIGGPMYGRDKIAMAVEQKMEELLARPEVQKEIQDAIEASALQSITEETKRRTKDYIQEYSGVFRDKVRAGVDAYLEAHKNAVQARVDEAMEMAMAESTIFLEVAKYQFAKFLGNLASEAVEKAVVRKAKKDAKAKK
jgi:hypothetical protein